MIVRVPTVKKNEFAVNTFSYLGSPKQIATSPSLSPTYTQLHLTHCERGKRLHVSPICAQHDGEEHCKDIALVYLARDIKSIQREGLLNETLYCRSHVQQVKHD